MTFKRKIFENPFPKSSFRAGKSSRLGLLHKKPGLWDWAELQFCPYLTDRAQNFVNVVAPGPVHEYQILFALAAICRCYSR